MARGLATLVSILLIPMLLLNVMPVGKCDANIAQFEKPSRAIIEFNKSAMESPWFEKPPVVEFEKPSSVSSGMPEYPQPPADISCSIILSVGEDELANPKLALAVHYIPEKLSISPNVSPYQLPLEL